MPKKSKLRDFLEFFVLLLALYILTQFALRQFFPQYFGSEKQETGVVLSMQDATVKGGHHPVAILKNHTEGTLTFEDRCPMPPVEVSRLTEEGFIPLETEETALPCESLTEVEPGARITISLAPWKYSLFSEYGTYQLSLPL